MDGSKLANFKSFTGVTSDDEALFYLKQENFNVQNAVQKYYNSPGLYKPVKNDQPIYQKKKKEKKKFGRLTDHLSQNKKSDDEYFAGGGPKSGTSIYDPKKNDAKDLTSMLFNKAKQQSKPKEKAPKKKVEKINHWDNLGGGSKLGNTKSDPSFISHSQPVMGQKSVKKQNIPEERDLKIVFWKNGFTIDDSPLMSYTDPKNKSVLEALNKGFVPFEYSKGSKHVNAQLVNQKTKMYVPPPKVFKPFEESKGNTLGGGPIIVKKSGGSGSSGGRKYQCDLNKPHTTILVRLADGTRVKMKFNVSDTVATVKSVIKMATNVSNDFDLMTSFPKKVLSNMSLTITQAKLENSQIIQKLK